MRRISGSVLLKVVVGVTCLGRVRAEAGQFEVLGTPVKTALLMASAVGPDERGDEVLYFDCAQPGSRLFLLQAEPKTGRTRQIPAPVGEGAWAMIIGPDNCVYLGTWESGHLLKFDSARPNAGLQDLGKPSASETYIWQLALGNDSRLYGCTYPNAKLVRYDPKSGTSEDLGRLDPQEMYSRSVAASTNGDIYVGIGMVRAQVAWFHPKTGQTKPLLEDAQRPAGCASVFAAVDGRAYANIAGKVFRCDGGVLTQVSSTPAQSVPKFRDGTVLSKAEIHGASIQYELRSPNGQSLTNTAKFKGGGLNIFVVGAGPGGRVFGSTAMPLEMFDYAPTTAQLRDLGNPTDVNGEIYSFAHESNLLYLCAYPGSFLSVYDPAAPWHYGRNKGENPRGIGPMGAGHLRPRAMVLGPDGRIYVGSLPPYGQVGGALGVYDPKSDSVVENYRNIVTNQGISALCFEPQTGRLFAGSSIEAGGGAVPVAREAVVLAWETKERRKNWEETVVPGDTTVAALTAADGKVFGVTFPSSTLFILDGKSCKVLWRGKIPFGRFHEISLGFSVGKDRIYGLAGSSIFAVDPDTLAMTEVARSPEPISCGFALTETGIYFGSGTRLVRWRW